MMFVPLVRLIIPVLETHSAKEENFEPNFL